MNIELLTIYTLSADGSSYARFLVDGAPVELLDYSYVTERMGATSLTATVRHAKCLDALWTGREFVVLDEGALVEGGVSAVEKFFLAHTPSSRKDNTDARYEHTLEFRAGRDILLSGVYFCDAVNPSAASAGKPVSNSYEVRFVGTLDEFVQRFNDVLAHRGLSGRFSVSLEAGVQGTTESLEIQFDKVTLADALQQAVETWKVPFYFLGDGAVFGSADSMPLVDVEYGADDELLSVAMTNRNEKRVTRISGYGSSDNVPYYYPNPSPKGTLGLGGTFSAGAQIADMVKFAQRVGAADTLTYMGDEPSLSLLRVLFGGKTGENAPGGVTAGVEDVTMESGRELPLLVSLNADLSGGFDRRISIPLYANVGCMEQVDPDEPVYYVYAHDPTGSYGGTYKYVTRKGRDVAAQGWDIVVDRVEMAFEAGAQPLFLQVPYAEEYASRDVAPEDRDLYNAETLSAVVVDVEEALKLFSNPDTSHCRIYVYAHVASRVKWQKLIGVTAAPFAPAQFEAQRVEATTVFDASGWYDGDEPIGADLSEVGLRVTGTPQEGDTLTQVVLGYVTPAGRLMPSIYRDTAGAQRTYDADNTPPPAYAQAYVNPDTGQNYVFEHEYDAREPHEHVEEFDVKPTIANLQDGQGHALNVLDSVWFDDGYNVRDLLADGQTLKYQYFFVKLKALGFNLFDCAIENGEMALVMSDGPCAGCHFKILVTEDGKNPVQRNANGTLKKEGASGHQKGVIDAGNIQAAQQDTTANAVWVALYLDDQTFGGGEYGTMPAYDKNTNSGPKPAAGDSYTAENILLPQAFFTAAEQELDRRIVRFMWENNADKFDPTVGFSRIYLAENPTVRAGLCDHSRLSLSYAGRTFSPLYVSQFTLNVKEGEPLPEVLVTTKDVVEPRTAGLDERIAAAAEAAVNVVLPATGGSLSQEDADKRYLRKDKEDTSPARPTFQRGINIGDYRAGLGGIGGSIYTNAAGEAIAEVDFLNVRRKATFTQVEVEALRKVSGTILLSLAEATITAVEEVSGGWKCWFKTDAVDGSAIANGFAAGDQAICRTLQGNRDHYYWRLVTEVGTDYIVLSASDADNGSDAPEVGDAVVQLGNRTDAARQCAQILSCYGDDSPSYVIYAGINSYALAGKEISGFVYRESTPGSGVYRPHFFNYGSMLLGDPSGDRVTFTPASGATPAVLEVRGRVIVQGSEGGDVDLSYLTIALPLDEDATVVDGGVILSKAIVLTDAQGNVKAGINGLTTLGDIAAWYGGPMADHEADPTLSSYAKSLFRFDGSGYLAGGNIHWGADGYGGIPGITWSREGGQDVVTIGGNVRLESVSDDTVTNIVTAVQTLSTTYVDFVSAQTISGLKTFTPGVKFGSGTTANPNADLEVVTMNIGGTDKRVLHTKLPIVSDDFMSAFGASDTPGASGIDAEAMWHLLGASTAEQIAASHLQTAFATLNLGAAATYGVGQVESGNNGLVTGGAVFSYVTGVLSSVLKFQGTTTTAISDGSTTNPITINGASYTAQKGDVVLYSGKEYLWEGSSWEQLGDESSWALKTTKITAGTGLSGGGTLAANRTISLSSATIASLALADTAYQKPSSGIPASDLASAVQTSLGKADTAIQTLYDLVVKNSGGTVQLTYKPGVSATYELTLTKSMVGLGNVENTKLSTWAGSGNITTLGTIGTGTWQGSAIGTGYGGTGLNSYTKGNIIYASATDTLAKLSPNATATKKYLTMTSSVPSWGNITFGDLPTLYIGNAAVQNVAQTAQNIGGLGVLTLANGKAIDFLNNPAEGETAVAWSVLQLSTTNKLFVGFDSSKDGAETYLYGSTIYLRYGTGHLDGMTINSTAITAHRDLIPDGTRNLGSATAMWKYTYTNRLYLNANTYFMVDSDGNVRLVVDSSNGKGFYCDGFMSAFGHSSTPGGGGLDPEVMWAYLRNTATDATYNNAKIHTAHLPSLTANNGLTASYSGTPDNTALTIGVGSGYKLPTTTEWGNKQDKYDFTITGASGSTYDLANFITSAVTNVAVGGSGHTEELAVTKNGTTSYLTIPYATTAKRFKRYAGTDEVGGYDLNTLLSGGGITSQYNGSSRWANRPDSMSFGGVLQINPNTNNTLSMQLAWDVVDNRTQEIYKTGKMWWRDYNAITGWGSWHIIYDNASLLLNGAEGGESTLTFFAPTAAGTAGQILKSGGANTAPAWTSSALGSATKHVYLNSSGVLTEGNAYAGGTKVTLNGADKGATTAAFFAPTGAGTAGQILLSGGANTAPAWSSAALGAANKPVYINASGVLTEGSACVTLAGAQTITGAKTLSANLTLNNAVGLYCKDTNDNSVEALCMSSSDTLRIGYGNRTAGRTGIYGKTLNIAAYSTASGPDIYIGGIGTTHNIDAANIYFHSLITSTGIRNGVKVAAEHVASADRLNLSVYTSKNTTSPYAPSWNKTLEVTYDGKVNVNAPAAASATATFNVNGTIWASTGIWSDGYMSAYGLASSSDKRLKDNIKDFAYTPELLMSLKPREWDWNGKASIKGHAAGFVAQEVEPHLPYAVTERVYKQLFYDTFHAIEMSGLQDHETRIKALEAENKQLKEEIKRLRAI